jgi:hypothetical protein
VLGLSHDNVHGGGVDTASDAPANNGRAGSSAPARARSPHVGWQSLLPGSIQ